MMLDAKIQIRIRFCTANPIKTYFYVKKTLHHKLAPWILIHWLYSTKLDAKDNIHKFIETLKIIQ